MKSKKRLFTLIVAVFSVVAVVAAVFLWQSQRPAAINTQRLERAIPSGARMMGLIEKQLSFGPRHIGTRGHEDVRQFLSEQLEQYADEFIKQPWTHQGEGGQTYELTNLIGRFNPEQDRRIILGTHYDSQKYAHNDASQEMAAVPGANDSASGVAILLQLAEVLNKSGMPKDIGVDIVFFDGEEDEGLLHGDYSDWKPLGSHYFVDNLTRLYPAGQPAQVVVLDMVCDSDLRLKREQSSLVYSPAETNRFWRIGQQLAPGVFAGSEGPRITDDHTPFGEAGIPSLLVIDFTYPYFHTTEDTIDKCSPQSLTTVARTMLQYVYSFQ